MKEADQAFCEVGKEEKDVFEVVAEDEEDSFDQAEVEAVGQEATQTVIERGMRGQPAGRKGCGRRRCG